MNRSVAQVESPMAAEDHLSPLLGPPPGASQVSTPSPLPPINADAAMQFEVAHLRAELSLIQSQMMEARDVSPTRRRGRGRSSEPSHREAETPTQDAEEAAKFYKEQWRLLKIQVGEQNKAIAELRVQLQRPQTYNLSAEFEEARESEPVAAGQGEGNGGGRPDPMWQSQGDAWGQWKKAQPPGLSESGMSTSSGPLVPGGVAR